MSCEITMIPIGMLRLHPNNPRKNYGDLTELTDSIKAQGIISPLTVIPRELGNVITGYWVLAGNCRLQAARDAGLKELPCIVREDMSDKDQMAYMLSENMARRDLTVMEEADGIEQLSLFGASDDDVKQATGLSLTTIRKRRKLSQLAKKVDRHDIENGLARGATIEDFMKLAAIDDDTDRKNALERIGTSSFDQWVRTANANAAIRNEHVQPALTALIKVGAKQLHMADLRYYTSYVDIGQYYTGAKFKPKAGIQYYYVLRKDGLVVSIYTKKEDQPEKSANEARQEQQREEHERIEKELARNRERITQLAADAQESREKYIKSFNDWDKGTEKLLYYWAVRSQTNGRYSGGYFFNEAMHRILDVPLNKNHEIDQDAMDDITVRNPKKALLAVVYASLASSAGSNPYWYERFAKGHHVMVYRKGETMDEVYRFMFDFEYETFDEEDQMRDGTLPEYYKEGDDK